MADKKRFDVRAMILDLGVVAQAARHVVAGPTPDHQPHASTTAARNCAEHFLTLLDCELARHVIAMDPKGCDDLWIVGRKEFVQRSRSPALAAFVFLYLQSRVANALRAAADLATAD